MRIRPESALTWAAAAVGIVGIASALTPEIASRSELVQGVLPSGVPAAARVATLAFGLGLVWLSRSLARRRRRAWQLAVVVVVAIAFAHLAKGLDVEEASASAALLVALLRYRRRFDVPGDPATLRPLLATGFALAAAGGLALWLDASPGPDQLDDLLGAASLVLAARALWLWLRPLSERVRQPAEEHRAARELVRAYGRDSLAFFALRRDKSYLFSPTRRAFLAYRVVGGAALVSGDPIGDESEVDALLEEFRRTARARGWRVAVLGARSEQLERYRRLGLRALPLGEEAVLRPETFSLEGRAIRKVRQSARRLERAGYRFRVVPVGEAGPELRARVDAVSAAWRGRQPERGFSMAMDGLYAPDTLLAIAEDASGVPAGFLHLVPAPAAGGYSLSTMRRLPGSPNGLMEFLIVETIAWAASRAVSELSLNFCAFGELLRADGRGWRRPVRRLLRALDGQFQIERLLVFNRKFLPEWRPRYLCVERLSDLPAVALAYLRVESLLTLPARPAGRRRAGSR
ncbi:MAG TPA: phosphatidylglycerol lysyltransferase domain-containing protein [Gaiellaceae bacterium]|nr:phosphatidylglycerol lysyltransferase domain-containing protein [Gaiellaceae bacterium]